MEATFSSFKRSVSGVWHVDADSKSEIPIEAKEAAVEADLDASAQDSDVEASATLVSPTPQQE